MWKLLTVTCLVVAAVAALWYGLHGTTAGPPALVVTTTADNPDADIGAPGCATAGGLCSLRAAIEQANALGSGLITFDPSVFPPGAPATIAIDPAAHGLLPQITVPLTIDATGAGVIIEPATSMQLDYGLYVLDATAGTPTDFTLTGNGMTLRDFDDTGATAAEGDGIVICGDTGDGCGTGPVAGVEIADVNVELAAGRGVFVGAGDDSDVTVRDSSLYGNVKGVDANVGGDSLVSLLDNPSLSGNTGAEVEAGDGADVEVLNGTTVNGGDDGVNINAGDESEVDVVGQTTIDAVEGDGVTVETGDGSTVTIAENVTVEGGDNAIEVAAGADTGLFIQDNHKLNADGDQGVQIELGENSSAFIERQDIVTTNNHNALDFTLADGDTVEVHDNGELSGENGIGVVADGSVSVSVTDNGQIVGNDGKGIEITATALTVDIDDNNEIRGVTSSGIKLEGAISGSTIEGNGTIIGQAKRGIDVVGAVGAIDGLGILDNTITGSAEEGVRLHCDPLTCTGGSDNVISENTITDNGLDGILIDGGGLLGGNTIDHNVISGNDGTGISLAGTSGNLVLENTLTNNGTTHTGVAVTGTGRANTIRRNSMAANDGLGIDLGEDRLTPNDGGDGDSGPNDLLNFPEGLHYGPDTLTVTGTACASCTVELFATDSPPDDSGHGEGQTFIGSAVAGQDGSFSFHIDDAACGAAAGPITATATDGDGNTSEFSENAAGFPGTIACPTTPTPTASPQPTPSPAATATTQPTATRTPTPGGANDGDVNKDGSANSIDATLVLQNVAGLLAELPHPDNADVNEDGSIDSIDAQLILQYNAGLIDTLPV